MRAFITTLLAITALASQPSPSLAEDIKVLATTAVGGSLKDLVPAFEKQSGHKVIATLGPAAAMQKRVQEGETADVLIGTRGGLDGLIRDGKVVAQSDATLARSAIGVAVRKGAPKPDISTPEAFKKTLLAAKAISYSNPALGGASGVHLAKVMEQLGIGAQMMAKTVFPPGGGLAGALLVKGEVDLAVQQFSELLEAGDVQIVGPLPGDLQSVTVFAVGVPASAKQPVAARAFIQFLRSPEAAKVIKDKGLEPG